jgi:hypothetical protein
VAVVAVTRRLEPPGAVGGGASELLQVLRLRRRAPLLGAPVHRRHPPHQLLLQARPHLLDLHLPSDQARCNKMSRSGSFKPLLTRWTLLQYCSRALADKMTNWICNNMSWMYMQHGHDSHGFSKIMGMP